MRHDDRPTRTTGGKPGRSRQVELALRVTPCMTLHAPSDQNTCDSRLKIDSRTTLLAACSLRSFRGRATRLSTGG